MAIGASKNWQTSFNLSRNSNRVTSQNTWNFGYTCWFDSIELGSPYSLLTNNDQPINIQLPAKFKKQPGEGVKGAVSWGFCCFRSILCLSHYFEASVINKMLLLSYNEDIKWILSGRANHNKFLRIFGMRSIKTWKNRPFNPFPSMPSVATGERQQFQYLQILFNKKLDH